MKASVNDLSSSYAVLGLTLGEMTACEPGRLGLCFGCDAMPRNAQHDCPRSSPQADVHAATLRFRPTKVAEVVELAAKSAKKDGEGLGSPRLCAKDRSPVRAPVWAEMLLAEDQHAVLDGMRLISWMGATLHLSS